LYEFVVFIMLHEIDMSAVYCI